MTKSYRRDVQILFKMLASVDSARDVIKRFSVSFDTNSNNSLFKSKDAFDLCSFYLAQFGEKIKLLTNSSREDLSKVVNLDVLKYFRNIIDHDYDNVNKAVLQESSKII